MCVKPIALPVACVFHVIEVFVWLCSIATH